MQDRTLRPVKLLQDVLLIIQAAEFRSFREMEARGLGGVIDVGGTEGLFWGQLRSVGLHLNYRKLETRTVATDGGMKHLVQEKEIRLKNTSGGDTDVGISSNQGVTKT